MTIELQHWRRAGASFTFAHFAVHGKAPMRIGTEDPWALTELAKAGAWGGAVPQPRVSLGGTPHLGNLPLGALVCDGVVTGWLGHG